MSDTQAPRSLAKPQIDGSSADIGILFMALDEGRRQSLIRMLDDDEIRYISRIIANTDQAIVQLRTTVASIDEIVSDPVMREMLPLQLLVVARRGGGEAVPAPSSEGADEPA